MAGTAVSVVLKKEREHQATWKVGSCYILNISTSSKCKTSSCTSDSPTNFLYRVAFTVFLNPPQPTTPDLDWPQKRFYYGDTEEYVLEYSQAQSVEEAFSEGETVTCYVKPDTDEQVISLAPASSGNDIDIGYAFAVSCTICLSVMFILSLVGFVWSRKLQREREEELVRAGLGDDDMEEGENREARTKRHFARRVALLSQMCTECEVPTDQLAEGPLGLDDCAVCLDCLNQPYADGDNVNVSMDQKALPEDEGHADLEAGVDAHAERANDALKKCAEVRRMLGVEAHHVWRLGCGHAYHAACLCEWVLVGKGRTCPLCHAKLRAVAPGGQSLACAHDGTLEAHERITVAEASASSASAGTIAAASHGVQTESVRSAATLHHESGVHSLSSNVASNLNANSNEVDF
eukprot:CAMPEP_0185836646 /NCGR_PEP_ID=MMETSP1353-20130828/10078_1 /TAXON_ID=1077150 /ORGANISM="Erythrolobus australicus, Strain CCMP3124" /LENGTH=405 /DNA_ID=CAMNT_0028535457 /DNA_START=284 /DNA_END=1501 /DNA_ORIENTATION=-